MKRPTLNKNALDQFKELRNIFEHFQLSKVYGGERFRDLTLINQSNRVTIKKYAWSSSQSGFEKYYVLFNGLYTQSMLQERY